MFKVKIKLWPSCLTAVCGCKKDHWDTVNIEKDEMKDCADFFFYTAYKQKQKPATLLKKILL